MRFLWLYLGFEKKTTRLFTRMSVGVWRAGGLGSHNLSYSKILLSQRNNKQALIEIIVKICLLGKAMIHLL